MAKKTRKHSTRVQRSGGKTRSGGNLATVSISDLQAELRRRQRAARPLLRRRERLVEQLAAVDNQLTAHGIGADMVGESGATASASASGAGFRSARAGRKPGRKPGRPAGSARKPTVRRGGRGGNSMNLVEALQKVLNNKEMAVKDLVGAVQEVGYKTKSPNFRTIVNQTLTARPEVFKKVSRGVYTAK